MQLSYGSYTFDTDSCEVRSSRRSVMNAADEPVSQIVRVDVEGYLVGTDETDITAQCNELTTALRQNYRDLYFRLSTGGSSEIALLNNTSMSGVRIVEGVSWPDGKGAEHVNRRTFRFAAEAEYHLPEMAQALFDFEETVTVWGGEPVFVFLPALNGPPQKQMTYQQTPFQATQTGYAIGFLARPVLSRIAPPIWPNDLMKAPRVTKKSPKRAHNRYKNFYIGWEYEYASASPLVAEPNIWR